MAALVATERSVKWHRSLVARLLLEDQNVPTNDFISNWSSTHLKTVSQASKTDDILLTQGNCYEKRSSFTQAFLPYSVCEDTADATSCSPPQYQIILFFFSLYLVAFAQGGHQPCVQAFGADQFDSENPEECKAKSSFFNWWYLGLCGGPLMALGVLNYIQDNLSWALGFGIPCIVMGLALLIVAAGTATYRFGEKVDEKSPFLRIGQVFVRAFQNRRTSSSSISLEEEASGTLPHQGSQQFRFLNKALLSPDGSKEDGRYVASMRLKTPRRYLD